MKTVTGIFEHYANASTSVRALEALGVPSDDISIVSKSDDFVDPQVANVTDDAATGAGIGAAVGGIGGLLTGLGLMAIPGVGPVVAAGWLVATATGVLAGGVTGGAVGGIVGAMTDADIPEIDAKAYEEGLRLGGTLVVARVEDELEPQAAAILENFSWTDLEKRREVYAGETWRHSDAA